MYKQTAEELRIKKCAAAIVGAIKAIPPTNPAAVVEAIAAIKAPRMVKAYAYETIDRNPRVYGPDMAWHAQLRATRNHPTHGPAMFALFR